MWPEGCDGVVVRPRASLFENSQNSQQNTRIFQKYSKIVEVIDGVRLAGSYKQYILQDYKQLLRIRSLLARGRATLALETPEVIRRLFGGTATVPTRRSQPPPKRSAFLPDPIFWKVLEYWRLGDWRRPCTLPLD